MKKRKLTTTTSTMPPKTSKPTTLPPTMTLTTPPCRPKPIPTAKAAPKKESAAAAAKPPPPAAAAAATAATSFSVDAGDPLTTHYYAKGVNDYTDVVFRINGTMQKGEYLIQAAKIGLSVSFVRAIPSRSYDENPKKKNWHGLP